MHKWEFFFFFKVLLNVCHILTYGPSFICKKNFNNLKIVFLKVTSRINYQEKVFTSPWTVTLIVKAIIEKDRNVPIK